MTLKIDGLSEENIERLSLSYAESYCSLSKNYKTPDEMSFYTLDYFKNKVLCMLKDKTSDVFVLSNRDNVLGFIRFSPIPDPYKKANGGGYYTESCEMCHSGVLVHWIRSAYFKPNTKLDDNTVVLNQIYLHPDIQKQGIGTRFLDKVLPLIEQKYSDLIVEYNQNNKYAISFYQGLGIREVAKTQDLDQITPTKDYFSSVGIGYAPISVIRKHLAKKIASDRKNVLIEFQHRSKQRG